MGFYNPATLIEDGKRHGVDVKAIDVRYSDWECTLEPNEEDGLSIRMGLRYVKGLEIQEGASIVAARQAASFQSIEDFALRSRLDRGTLPRLAEAGSLEGFGSDRRGALWEALGILPQTGPVLELEATEAQTTFAFLNPFETINWDYTYTGHSTRGHPLGPLREELSRHGLPDAAAIHRLANGKQIRYAGLVICRQRPGTAKGVVFMTLEDETGFVNLVVWEKVFQRYDILVKTTSFLGVTGKLQIQSGVAHVVAEEFWIPDIDTTPAKSSSRDFH